MIKKSFKKAKKVVLKEPEEVKSRFKKLKPVTKVSKSSPKKNLLSGRKPKPKKGLKPMGLPETPKKSN